MLKKIYFILKKGNNSKNFFLLSILNIFYSIIELVGLISISVIVLLVINPDLYLNKINSLDFIKYIPEFLIGHLNNINQSMYLFAIIFIIVTIIKFIIKYLSIRFLVSLSIKTSGILFKNYLNKKFIDLFEVTSAKLLNLANFHSNRFANSIVSPILNLINSMSLLLILLISFVVVGGYKIIYSLSFVTLACVVIYFTVSKKISLNEKKIIDNDIKRQGILMESITNIKYLILSNKIIKLINFYNVLGKISARSMAFNQSTLHFAKPFLEILFVTLAVIFIDLNLKKDQNLIEYLPILSFFLLSSYRMLPGIQIIYQALVHIKGNLRSVYVIEQELLNSQKIKQIPENISEKISFNENLKINNLTFGYNNNFNLFENVNLDIKKNSCIAFYGKSGQGKTSIIDVICGLMEPKSGHISIDNKKINKNNLMSYQNKIGYLSQYFYIIDDTLINNVIFSDEKTKENIKKAKYFINQLFETTELDKIVQEDETVGENGLKLSHGQKQRLIIVRLLYENKEILILDEPTSSIDEKNILKLKSILEKLKLNKTIILTTHNKEILKICDKVFLVDDKKVLHIENDKTDQI